MNYRIKLRRFFWAACLPLLTLDIAYAARPPKIAAFATSASASALMQRHPAAAVESKAQTGPAYGLYPAIVISGPDPHMRVQVEIPALNISAEWASPCVPVGSVAVPPVRSRVWVMFEQGNTHMPVWMGIFPGN